jgi:acetyl-CoA carboxylase, biotin carboxylase subunit
MASSGEREDTENGGCFPAGGRARAPAVFERVLIANRGEIARRVIRACRALGVESVAVYSEADAEAPHVREADQAVAIGPAPPRDSYLSVDAILEAVRRSGADAVHPGYGFLSENAEFARAVRGTGVTFVGPAPEAIEAMGDKAEARRRMAAAGVPVVPGSPVVSDGREAEAAAAGLGYPVMIKASAGGGGIGMLRCADPGGLARAFESAAARARAAFGDGSLYLERAIDAARHVEVQIAADAEGRQVHLFERECSVQRRHQKVLEEAPSPAVDPALREALGVAALRAAEAIGYENLGTVEFLLDASGHFYFMEMNTRLQVEHPVTEWTTGVDLVQLQLRLAAGEPLPFEQQELRQTGHAIELRLYAENPDKNFLPSPGTIERLVWPEGADVRVDAGVEEGCRVTPHYDPLLAKLVVRAASRAAAIERAAEALGATVIEGIHTNLSLHRRILADPDFQRGTLTTEYLAGLTPVGRR